MSLDLDTHLRRTSLVRGRAACPSARAWVTARRRAAQAARRREGQRRPARLGRRDTWAPAPGLTKSDAGPGGVVSHRARAAGMAGEGQGPRMVMGPEPSTGATDLVD